MSTLSRRTALSMLGLASASAVTAEDFSPTIPNDHNYRFGLGVNWAGQTAKMTISALRRLADDIEAKGSHVQEVDLSAHLDHDEFLTHKLSIRFVLSDKLPEGIHEWAPPLRRPEQS